jgi:hypothetical protein
VNFTTDICVVPLLRMASVKVALSISRKTIAGVEVMLHSFLPLGIAERV